MLKFDDQFPLHRKVAALSDAAFRLHVEAIFWSRRNLTDGFVPTADLCTVGRFSRPDRFATECVQRGAWHRVDGGHVDGCDECSQRHNGSLAGDGWVIHGFADWQQTRSKVLHNRTERSKAGQAGGVRSGEARRKRGANPKQVASPPLPNERTPEPPRPPTGGSGGVGAAKAVVAQLNGTTAPRELPKPHPFADDGTGQSCSRCLLLRINKVHTVDQKGRRT